MSEEARRGKIFPSHGSSDWHWFKDKFGEFPDEYFKDKYVVFSKNLRIALGPRLDKFSIEIREAYVAVVILSREYITDEWLAVELGQLMTEDQNMLRRKGREFVILTARENIRPTNLDSLFRGKHIIQLDPSSPRCLEKLSTEVDLILGKIHPVIFISHSSEDENLVKALVDLMESALHLKGYKILCTSLKGRTLRPGARVDEVLRMEVRDAEVLIALITPNSESNYFMFELGARWGANRPLFRLAAGVSLDDKSPLSTIHGVDCTNKLMY